MATKKIKLLAQVPCTIIIPVIECLSFDKADQDLQGGTGHIFFQARHPPTGRFLEAFLGGMKNGCENLCALEARKKIYTLVVGSGGARVC